MRLARERRWGKYWMIVFSGATTEYQWQDGYSNIGWQWNSGRGRSVPAHQQRDWSVLGLSRYRVGRIEKLRVPAWLPFLFVSVFPAIWLWRMRRDWRADAAIDPLECVAELVENDMR